MSSFNRVILMGNLTRDPQIKYTPGGAAVVELGIAVGRVWFDKQTNQKREETTFVDVTVWGRQAEVAGEYLTKGRPILIEGRLQLDVWDDKQTQQKRSKLRVVCENMTMLGSRDSVSGVPATRASTADLSDSSASSDLDVDVGRGAPVDEIPF